MRKQAEIKTTLQPHQKRALIKALRNNLILAHGTGTGKTLTAIAIADALGKPATALVPAPLVANFKKRLPGTSREVLIFRSCRCQLQFVEICGFQPAVH